MTKGRIIRLAFTYAAATMGVFLDTLLYFDTPIITPRQFSTNYTGTPIIVPALLPTHQRGIVVVLEVEEASIIDLQPDDDGSFLCG